VCFQTKDEIMHLLVPQGYGHLTFNVDNHVGPACPNKIEDVLLVQFLLVEVGGITIDTKLKAILLKVPKSGTCDAATIEGIRALQQRFKDGNPATVVDGIISPAKGAMYGGAPWTIILLNVNVRGENPDMWPRLQDFTGCPALLKPKVQALL